MKNTNSRTTCLKEFIIKLYPSALEARSCTQARIAETFENRKAAIKRPSRFLHNPRLRTKDLAEGVATEFVSHISRHVFVRIIRRSFHQ